MDTSLFQTRRAKLGHYASHIVPVLVALTAGQGILSAANLLNTYASTATGAAVITSVTLNCSTTAGGGASGIVVVKPLTAVAAGSEIIVSASSLPASGGVAAGTPNALAGTGAASVIITPPSSQILTSTVTSLTYTISLSTTASVGCQGVTTAAPTFSFNHISGPTSNPGTTVVADVGMTVNTEANSGTSSATASALTSAATVTLSCVYNGSTYFPGAAQTVTVGSGAAGGTPFALDSAGSPATASWVTYPTALSSSQTATSGAPVTFTVQALSGASGCGNAGLGSLTSYIYLKSINLGSGVTVSDKVITVNLTVSNPAASALVVNPSPITVTCVQSGSLGSYSYSPNYPQTVSVTAPTTTTFSVGTTPPGWLNIGTPSAATASTTASTFTVQATGTCNGGVATTTTIHLVNSPAQDKVFAVTLQIVPASILTATPTSATFTYVKGSGTAGYADVAIGSNTTSVPNPYFSVNAATLPTWLRTDISSGNAPQSIRFSSTSVADSLAPGTYTATVYLSVSGYGDKQVSISMLLTNKAAQLTIQGPTTVSLNWIVGQGLPTPTITAISTDTPIPYTATTGGSLAPVIAAGEQSGLAYSFGTPIGVSFSPAIFAGAQPGQVLTGTVTLTWGSPVSTIVVTFDITVLSPGATITGLTPGTLPVGSASYSVALVGTGFVLGTPGTQATRVGVVTTSGAAMTFDPAITANIVNQSNITLTFVVPSGTDSNIPFAGGTMVIGVCNPVGGVACTIASASASLIFGTHPIVQAVTSSSSLLESSGTVTVAPYDMISIFGANFCPNCQTNQVLTGAPDPVTLTYPTTLPFTPTSAQTSATPPVVPGVLAVTFQPHTGSAWGPVSAPLLFATNTQINLLVPSAVSANISSGTVDIIVSYGAASGTPAPQVSPAFNVAIAATDPGIFTVGADGQGSGAILDANYSLISATNPAGIRSHTLVPGTSDTVAIYMTGLGIPDSTASNASVASDGAGGTGGLQWSADCVTPGSYLTSFNSAQTGTALTTLDGTLIIPSVLNTGRLVPCLLSSGGSGDVPVVTIGGQPAVVTYAGWVPGTIAGLYQVNVQLPDNTAAVFTTEGGATNYTVTAPTQLPVLMTSNSVSSQTGVSIWVAPKLLMTGPTNGTTANTLTATVGTPLPGTYAAANAVTATGGVGNITYAVTSGLLPAGLSIVPSGGVGVAGQIIGTPAANTGNPGSNAYTVTVTATDSETIPVTGTNTFVVTVGEGLFLTNSTPGASVFGTANAAVATVTATGGLATYTYFLPNGFTTATGIAINPTTGVVSTSTTTPAGSYALAVTAYDSTTGTPIQGTLHFTIVVNLNEVLAATGTSFTAGTTTGAANTMTTTGQGAGTLTYSLDAGTQALVNGGELSFSTTTGILTVNTTAVAGTTTVTITVNSSATPTDGSAGGTATQSFSLVLH